MVKAVIVLMDVDEFGEVSNVEAEVMDFGDEKLEFDFEEEDGCEFCGEGPLDCECEFCPECGEEAYFDCECEFCAECGHLLG